MKAELYELPRDAIEGGLNDGSLDLAVMLVSNLQDKKHLAHEVLMRSRRRLWLPVEHHLLSAETITLEDVAEEPYVMLTVDEASQTATRYWKPTGVRPNIVFKTSSVEAVRSMVADGIGITILSDMVYRSWSLEGQRIELRNVVADIPTMDIGLAWNRSRPQTPATKSFHDFLSLSFGGAAGPGMKPNGCRQPGGVDKSRWMPVALCGMPMCMDRKKLNISSVTAGQKLGIKEVDNGIWLVSFMPCDLGYTDLEQKTLQPRGNPFGPGLSPMS